MSLKIKRQSDTRVVHACTHNLADIPNGVTVCSKELVAGTRLQEGTAIGKGEDGLFHVIKTAQLAEGAAATATVLKVAKGSHFKQGDVIMAGVGKKAVTITAINRDGLTSDEITVSETLGALSAGATLTLAAATGASGAFKYTPKALTGDHYDVKDLENHLVSAVTIGQFKESVIPPITTEILAALKGIVLI